MSKPVTAVIVGAGHRAMLYADLALTNPELLQIVGVADPNPVRRQAVMQRYGFPQENRFADALELAKRGRLADAVINGTMDWQHVETSLPLLELGYDMLLEKPFAVNQAEMHRLVECVRAHGNKVMICHVLRYSSFYQGIKERILKGEIGDIIHIQTQEHVSYHHLSTAYVRGKWANSGRCKTSMLLAKCCHDLDIMMWLMSETRPAVVSSLGGKFQFKPENAPENAGERCLADCPLVDTCRYSAKRLYLDQPARWAFYVWDRLEHIENPTQKDRINLLKGDSPYGRCIYKCDNDVVDHQSVLVQFASGATGVHNLVGGTASSLRRIHITGTKGEIYGSLEEGKFYVAKIHPTATDEKTVETVELKERDSHGGGDRGLAMDFISYVRGEQPSVSCTSLFDSIPGHLCIYLADRSLQMGGMPQRVEL
ncbi:MAG: Gfo/Idh/MocA family oxidoreductase [Clostridiales bacterium]|nr:Gfo/Idh/MocA family oxidoreductase [Clostridiales bacterium]